MGGGWVALDRWDAAQGRSGAMPRVALGRFGSFWVALGRFGLTGLPDTDSGSFWCVCVYTHISSKPCLFSTGDKNHVMIFVSCGEQIIDISDATLPKNLSPQT